MTVTLITLAAVLYYVVCVAGCLYLLHRDPLGDGSISLFGAVGAAIFGWLLPMGLLSYGAVRLVDWMIHTKVWKPKNRNRSYRMVWDD